MTTRTSFDARVSSVSSKLEQLGRQSTVPSAAVDKRMFPGIPFPQVEVSTPSSPNSPRQMLTVVPTILPTEMLLGLTTRAFLVSSPLASSARPIEITFFYIPWPAAAASSDVSMSSFDMAFAIYYPLVSVSVFLCPV